MKSLFTALALAVFSTSLYADDLDRAQTMIDRGLAFLKSAQRDDGGFLPPQAPPAIDALVLRAFVQEEAYTSQTDFVERGYANLLSKQLEDGGIYADLLANYNTAIAISSLEAADDPDFRPAIDRALAYLRRLQWTTDTRPQYQGEGEQFADQQVVKEVTDSFYGGFGYGGRSRGPGRPDLSNTHLSIEAMRDAGVDPYDPAMQRALVFVSRLQNLRATNNASWAGDDGGFVYGPSHDRTGESMAGSYTDDDGIRRLRSYGSMTYAGLKSFIYAGLSREDVRVQAAWEWIGRNWTLDANPGMQNAGPENADDGLYYYYHTLARALNVYDSPVIETPGGAVDWRGELIDKLESLQRDDGSWAGDKRWMEDNPILVTAYVVLTLQETRQDLIEHR
jgi:squalene-hopene/tetraprenyl-beta-curcumene cyclase